MARQFWPGADPIRQHLLSLDEPPNVREIIGVVGNVKSFGLDQENRARVDGAQESGDAEMPVEWKIKDCGGGREFLQGESLPGRRHGGEHDGQFRTHLLDSRNHRSGGQDLAHGNSMDPHRPGSQGERRPFRSKSLAKALEIFLLPESLEEPIRRAEYRRGSEEKGV